MRRGLFLTVGWFFILQPAAQAQNAWINEFHYDNAGADVNEFVEIVIENAFAFTLDDFTLVLYNGNGGVPYSTHTLGTFTEGATVGNYTFFYKYIAGIQNGAPDGLALCYQGNLIQLLSYEGVLTANGGCADGNLSTDIGVAESGATGDTESLQLTGSGSDYADFSWAGPAAASPGMPNTGQTLISRPVVNTNKGTSYTTLQAAIDDADPYDQLELQPGTYSETITINKPLSVVGASSGLPKRSTLRTRPHRTQSIGCTLPVIIDATGFPIGINIAADDVYLSGFCVTGATNANLYTNATISNLTLDQIESVHTGPGGYGFDIDNLATVDSLIISEAYFAGHFIGMQVRGSLFEAEINTSTFDQNQHSGLYITHGNDTTGSTFVWGLSILDTRFSDNPCKGIYAEKLDQSLFRNVMVENSGTSQTPDCLYPEAIDLNLKYGFYEGLVLDSLHVTGSIGTGLHLKGGVDDGSAVVSTVLIQNSYFADNRIGVAFGGNVGDGEGLILQTSAIVNNGNEPDRYIYQDTTAASYATRGGVLVYNTPLTAWIAIFYSCIVNNGTTEYQDTYGFGLSNAGDAPVEAINVWWGQATGPVFFTGTFTEGNYVFEGADVVTDPFATEPYADIEGCGGPVGTCTLATLGTLQVLNPSTGRAQILGADGIQIVQNSPTQPNINLELVNVTDGDGNPVFTEIAPGIWEYTGGGSPPTEAWAYYQRLDTNDPNNQFFLQVSTVCPSEPDGTLEAHLDPHFSFGEALPATFAVRPAAPNPFYTRTTLVIELPQPAHVMVRVFDLLGREVALLTNRTMLAGTHQIVWEPGRSGLSGGTYLLQLIVREDTGKYHRHTQLLTFIH